MSDKKTVLVLEDDQDIQLLYQELLTPVYEVHCYESADDFLTIIAKDVPHLVIVDIELPGTTGYEVCGKLRRQPTAATLPIIIVTGHSIEEDDGKAFSCDVSDYIQKPFNGDHLLSTIDRLIQLESWMRASA